MNKCIYLVIIVFSIKLQKALGTGPAEPGLGPYPFFFKKKILQENS